VVVVILLPVGMAVILAVMVEVDLVVMALIKME